MEYRGWRDSVLVLHMADPGWIPSIPCSSLIKPGTFPKWKAKNKPCVQQCVVSNQRAKREKKFVVHIIVNHSTSIKIKSCGICLLHSSPTITALLMVQIYHSFIALCRDTNSKIPGMLVFGLISPELFWSKYRHPLPASHNFRKPGSQNTSK